MNKFKRPQGSRTSSNRPSPRDARTYRNARSGDKSEAFPKFDAVCSNCGKRCQVPFRPDSGKPVYCKDCFNMPRKAIIGNKKFPIGSAPRFSNSINFGSVTPTSSATIPAGGKSIADLTRQIAAMNAKIDTMLKILTEGADEEK